MSEKTASQESNLNIKNQPGVEQDKPEKKVDILRVLNEEDRERYNPESLTEEQRETLTKLWKEKLDNATTALNDEGFRYDAEMVMVPAALMALSKFKEDEADAKTVLEKFGVEPSLQEKP